MTNDLMPSPYTVLTQDVDHILRLVQRPLTTILQEFGPRGLLELELNDEGLQALLQTLPRAVLEKALAALPPRALTEDLPNYTPVWDIAQAAYLCTHCGRGARAHAHTPHGAVLCTSVRESSP